VSTVPGDPGSVSACAGTVRAVADRLARIGPPLGSAVAELADGWPGRASATTRRRGGSLAAAAGTTSAALERVAGVHLDHAPALADLGARARRAEDRAAAAGLAVRDGRVVPAYGVTGEADADGDRARAETAAALQRELDGLRALHARRRDWVLGVLLASSEELSGVSHALRRG
jgi:hypothetical protein